MNLLIIEWKSDILAYIQEQTLFRVVDSVELSLTTFMAYNVGLKNETSVIKAIEGLRAIVKIKMCN